MLVSCALASPRASVCRTLASASASAAAASAAASVAARSAEDAATDAELSDVARGDGGEEEEAALG